VRRVEGAGLEHAVLPGVEVGEVDEVAQDAAEVALQAHGLVDRADLGVLVGERGLAGDQSGEPHAQLGGVEPGDPVLGEGVDLGGRLGVEPRLVRASLATTASRSAGTR